MAPHGTASGVDAPKQTERERERERERGGGSVHGVVGDGVVDLALIDTRQVATDTNQLHTTDTEQRRRVVVRHGDLQVDRVVEGVRVGADRDTVVCGRVD